MPSLCASSCAQAWYTQEFSMQCQTVVMSVNIGAGTKRQNMVDRSKTCWPDISQMFSTLGRLLLALWFLLSPVFLNSVHSAKTFNIIKSITHTMLTSQKFQADASIRNWIFNFDNGRVMLWQFGSLRPQQQHNLSLHTAGTPQMNASSASLILRQMITAFNAQQTSS